MLPNFFIWAIDNNNAPLLIHCPISSSNYEIFHDSLIIKKILFYTTINDQNFPETTDSKFQSISITDSVKLMTETEQQFDCILLQQFLQNLKQLILVYISKDQLDKLLINITDNIDYYQLELFLKFLGFIKQPYKNHINLIILSEYISRISSDYSNEENFIEEINSLHILMVNIQKRIKGNFSMLIHSTGRLITSNGISLDKMKNIIIIVLFNLAFVHSSHQTIDLANSYSISVKEVEKNIFFIVDSPIDKMISNTKPLTNLIQTSLINDDYISNNLFLSSEKKSVIDNNLMGYIHLDSFSKTFQYSVTLKQLSLYEKVSERRLELEKLLYKFFNLTFYVEKNHIKELFIENEKNSGMQSD
ncbi:hypothetical protein SNEBB_003366 [Seison nebaliae]|nr:hypothetical protein SNEBB_003366 [Seison nebaliae]